jgi:hypothetical protein
MVNRTLIKHILGDDTLNNLFLDFFTEGFGGDVGGVLG